MMDQDDRLEKLTGFHRIGAMHGISSKGNSASITSGNNPESSPGSFGPSGDYSAYGDWRHGDRWA